MASIYSVGLAHMSRFMREFLGANPQADVRLEYLHPHRVYEVVDSGDADLGLISYPEESKSLAAIPWRSEPMVLVCHPEHPLARQVERRAQGACGRVVRRVSERAWRFATRSTACSRSTTSR